MSNRLTQILPSSLTLDETFKGAAEAVGLEELAIFNQIPNINIWSRLPELSEDILDHLAYYLHIDGYSYCKSKADKLWLVENFHDWHRYKGTIYGHKLYWRKLLNREVYGHASRKGCFFGAKLSVEERARIEAPHPEVRIYPFRNKGVAKGYFLNSVRHQRFCCESTAHERVGNQVYCYDPLLKKEVKLNVISSEIGSDSVIEVAMPGRAVGMFGGGFPTFTVDQGAAGRLFKITLKRTPETELESRSSMSLQPMSLGDCYYKTRFEKGLGRGRFFPGKKRTRTTPSIATGFMGGSIDGEGEERKVFLMSSDASDRVFRYFKLYDPKREVKTARKAQAFMDFSRLGDLPPHYGEIAVDATGKAIRGAIYPGANFYGCGYPIRSDVKKRIAQITDVCRMAKRASDKIVISITNHKPVTFSPIHKMGSKVAGEYELKIPQ